MKHRFFICAAAFAGLTSIAAAADTVEPALTGEWTCTSDQSDPNFKSQIAWIATYGDDGTYTAESNSTVRTASVGRYRILSSDTGTYSLEDGLLVTTATDITTETVGLSGKVAENAEMKTRVENSVTRSAQGSVGKPKTRRLAWSDEDTITLQDNAEGAGTHYQCARTMVEGSE
ncbi:MAG: hypothetical protein WA989_04205 [Henriciella sp.]|uniref:hypothetical protein n=1 Tax=Henriciella sp. TaxID=1968823 RepID=UPI003C724294